ncbi:13988_t:CDS:2, partial [Dentiscutata heterogama]
MSSSNNLESAHELFEHNISNESNNMILEQELYEFFADMKCQDGKLYKPESIISACTSLRYYLFE